MGEAELSSDKWTRPSKIGSPKFVVLVPSPRCPSVRGSLYLSPALISSPSSAFLFDRPRSSPQHHPRLTDRPKPRAQYNRERGKEAKRRVARGHQKLDFRVLWVHLFSPLLEIRTWQPWSALMLQCCQILQTLISLTRSWTTGRLMRSVAVATAVPGVLP